MRGMFDFEISPSFVILKNQIEIKELICCRKKVNDIQVTTSQKMHRKGKEKHIFHSNDQNYLTLTTK